MVNYLQKEGKVIELSCFIVGVMRTYDAGTEMDRETGAADLTDRELKKLSRAELLEMLILQTEEVERLQEELAAMQERLRDRNVMLEKTGNIAEAALQINQVFSTAQAAAQQYLENIEKLEGETREKCLQLKRQTQQECRRMLQQTQQERNLVLQQTEQERRRILRNAEDEAGAFWEEIREKVKDPYREHMWWYELKQMLDERAEK